MLIKFILNMWEVQRFWFQHLVNHEIYCKWIKFLFIIVYIW